MEYSYIPQFEPLLGNEEKEQLCDCIDKNWITGGKKVKEFERRIAELCHVKHAISCSNGTMALFMALDSLQLPKGADVIVPDFTFIASANSVVLAGLNPVFCDVDIQTLNATAETIKKLITINTVAIMPVHIFGQAANMTEIMKLAKERDLLVVEDAAQGIGVSWQGKPVGSFGGINMMSFYADKTITTGEGGMLLTDDDNLAERSLILKHQGRTGRGFYHHKYIGYNFRMTDLQAGIGVAQLYKLPAIIRAKKKHEALYRKLLKGVDGIELPFVDDRGINVPFRHNIFVTNPKELSLYLNEQNIGSREFFYPLHLQPCYNIKADCPNAIWASEHGLSLPSSANLEDKQIEYICDNIKKGIAVCV